MKFKLEQSTTSRLLQHIQQYDSWAIISSYTDDNSQEKNLNELQKLKTDCKKYGFVQFVSKWVSGEYVSNERSLLIPNITKEQAINLGSKYRQKTIIFCDNEICAEICTTPFVSENEFCDLIQYRKNDIIRKFNTFGNNVLNIELAKQILNNKKSGPVSVPMHRGKPFTLTQVYQVYNPKPSYFQLNQTIVPIF